MSAIPDSRDNPFAPCGDVNLGTFIHKALGDTAILMVQNQHYGSRDDRYNGLLFGKGSSPAGRNATRFGAHERLEPGPA